MGQLITADVIDGLKTIPSNTVDCCVTSPPYYNLRDYNINGQIGLENSPKEYISKLVKVFNEVKRVLKSDGTLWVNIGDSYAGSGHGYNSEIKGKQATNKGTHFMVNRTPAVIPEGLKPKDLIGIPWMLAFALRHNGWYLRNDIIWVKSNPMPESVTDRCTKSHEYIFLLSKSQKYYFDQKAIKEPCSESSIEDFLFRRHLPKRGTSGFRDDLSNKSRDSYMPEDFMRNKRDVWSVPSAFYKEAHFAVYPPELIRPCILAGSRPGGIVLDPFIGSGTTAMVALQEGRDYIGIDLNPEYIKLAQKRIDSVPNTTDPFLMVTGG